MSPTYATKPELIALHQTLVQLRHDLEQVQLILPGAFSEYDAQRTTPLQIGHSRESHHAAIDLLALGFKRCAQARRGNAVEWPIYDKAKL